MPLRGRHLKPLKLDSPFERLTSLACAMFDTPHAMVGVVDHHRTLFRANVGLGADELPRHQSVTEVMVAMGPGAELVVTDGENDPRVADHPMVVGPPYLRFFAGVTVCDAEGRAVGALGVMDVKPRAAPTAEQMANLRVLAQMAGEMVDQASVVRTLAEGVELLRLAEKMAGVGQWRVDVATSRVSWSDEVYRIHGVAREAFDPCVDDALAFYHPDDRQTMADAVQSAIEGGEGYGLTLRLIRADGEVRLVEAHAECERAPDGRVTAVFGVFQDVTERETARRALSESEAAYRAIAERTRDIIAVFDLEGTFEYVSPAMERVLGWSPQELVGTKTWDLIHPEDHEPVRSAYRRVLADGPDGTSHLLLRYRGRRRAGGWVWLEAQPTVQWDAEGRAVQVQDNIRDVTETQRLEDQLLVARNRAEQAAKAKTEFLANMSHELRTPLTSVVGFAGLLQEAGDRLGAKERLYADRIATASQALLSVINDILDYSKLEADRVDLDPHPFDPRALARGAAGIVESQCAAKGVGLAVIVDPDLPAALMGDEGRLRQVTLNFLSNATKFTGSGGIRLEVGRRGDRLRVAVSDTGIGIAPEKIDALFERFTQADASTTRTYGGTGLGLAISRRLIEMMGGEIGAESRPGQGSTFWFEVPLIVAEGQVAAVAAEDVDAPTELKVLMADDAPANRELVTAILGGLGVAIETVENGALAVEAARSGAYDVILMDVHMPVMDGLDATRAIRAMAGPVGRTPIVALTANVQPEQVAACRAAGMDAHVGKPIQVAELLRTMAELTAEAEATDEAPARSVG